MSSDTNGTFVFYGGLMLLAIFICGATASQIVPGIIAIYFMLLATNSIARGQNRARRKTQQKFYRNKHSND